VIVDYLYRWGGLGVKLLHISSAGTVSAAPDQVAAGAAVLLVFFFVFTDALGRLVLRRADPRMRAQDLAGER
jgi:hypothetical protein